MALEPIRRLQVFRNGIVTTASRDEIKEHIHGLLDSGDLILKDGEPIFVRYMQKSDEAPKGLFGLYYDVDDEFGNHYSGIKWIDDGNVNILTEGDEYVNLTYTENNGVYTISAGANIVGLDDADCDACFLRITSLPEGAVYAKYQDTYYTLGQSFSIRCEGFEGKFYLYDSRHVDLGFDIAVQVVNGRITYLPTVPGFEVQFVEGGDGLASACDVKSHIEYYEIESNILDNNNDPIPNRAKIDVDLDSGLDQNGFNLKVYNLTIPISTQEGNCLTTTEDGELFAATTDSIADVRNIIVDPCPDGEVVSFRYGYLPGSNSYVKVRQTGNGWVVTDTGSPYTGGVSSAVDCGHTYLVIRTVSGQIYMTQNDASDGDTKVTAFTNNNGTLTITQSDGGNPLTVSVSGLTPYLNEALINWNNNDVLSVTQSGILASNALSTIERYIDNYDCGTF